MMSSIRTPNDKKTPSLLMITGWAYGTDAMQPLADALSLCFHVRILTGAQVLSDRSIPPADCIVTGSMGGLLALELLPDECRRLVLISSTAKFCCAPDYPFGPPERVLRRMIRQLQRRPKAVLEEFFKNVHHPHPCITTPASTIPFAVEVLVQGLEYLRNTDVRDRLSAIGIPVMLLHGAEDRIIPRAAAEWLHRNLPDSRLRIFENHGHALLAHQFDEVKDEILPFLLQQNR
jgi:pimeloyl-[acyl-carrier protein] methyl ester esterase